MPAARRDDEVRSAVQADVARVLGLGAASAATLDRPFSELGLDSLMAVELRNALLEGNPQVLHQIVDLRFGLGRKIARHINPADRLSHRAIDRRDRALPALRLFRNAVSSADTGATIFATLDADVEDSVSAALARA